MDSYRWGAGMGVTEPIPDIEQNVLLSSFEHGSSSSQLTTIFYYLSLSSRRHLLQT